MSISEHNKRILVKEIMYAIDKMRSTEDYAEKLYFLSVVHSMANRILNIEYDSELVFIHFVLSQSHAQISTRYNAQTTRKEMPVSIPSGLFESIENLLEDLAKTIKNNKQTHLILAKIAELAYSTTGNGYYLYQKGLLIIND